MQSTFLSPAPSHTKNSHLRQERSVAQYHKSSCNDTSWTLPTPCTSRVPPVTVVALRGPSTTKYFMKKSFSGGKIWLNALVSAKNSNFPMEAELSDIQTRLIGFALLWTRRTRSLKLWTGVTSTVIGSFVVWPRVGCSKSELYFLGDKCNGGFGWRIRYHLWLGFPLSWWSL